MKFCPHLYGVENLTDYTEALLFYVVTAEDPAGNVIYLEVYIDQCHSVNRLLDKNSISQPFQY